MPSKKVDNRVRTLIENSVKRKERSLIVLVGDRGRDQVVNIHYMMSKAQVKARPSVLWCYNKELGFSTHRQKRMQQIKKLMRKGVYDADRNDPFELFVTSTQVRWCYYKETHKILGQTYGMLVLQDFEALTPNLLCRTIETVEGGGTVVVLLRTMSSLKQLYTMAMDVHDRFRTEAHQDVVARFNERFLLSLTKCTNALVLDDELNILPISKHAKSIVPVASNDEDEGKPSARERELRELKSSLEETELVGDLIAQSKTLDQARSIMTCCEAISEKTLRSTVAVTAGRGRGKSAALGLSIAAAVGFGYSNIFVTSPAPENLHTLFEFVFKGLEALAYKEHIDYEAIASTNPEMNKAIVRVNIFRNQRQTIQYIHPSDADKLGTAELVVIDEAAAIPLPTVKRLLGPYLVFMASTINGYEGTGRSLSLKLIQQLRKQQAAAGSGMQANNSTSTGSSGLISRTLHEVSLEEPIRYAPGDPVEAWLNDLLCLDASEAYRLVGGLPSPSECELYLVDRDALFSGHRISDVFLHRMMSLYVSSHYKNTPNDLQLMSDAPAHRLFALLGPVDSASNKDGLPDILCVIQVAFEGKISRDSVQSAMKRGYRSSGDLIPWTISQQFQDDSFPQLSGARIVRIATHPDASRMGYGTKAMQLLTKYFQGDIVSTESSAEKDTSDKDVLPLAVRNSGKNSTDKEDESKLLDEKVKPRKHLPPLLVALTDAPEQRLHWIGVSFGLTLSLFKFWRRVGFVPVYLRQTANELTAEHTSIVLRGLNCQDLPEAPKPGWELSFAADFSRRYLTLLASSFRHFDATTALSVVDCATSALRSRAEAYATAVAEGTTAQNGSRNDTLVDWHAMDSVELNLLWTPHDLQRLEAYARNMVDYHMITDLLPQIARSFFLARFPGLSMSRLQSCVLLSVGLQHRSVDDLAIEMNVPATQLLALFNKGIRKISNTLRQIQEDAAGRAFDHQYQKHKKNKKNTNKLPNKDDANLANPKGQEYVEKLGLEEYMISGTNEDWNKAATALEAAASTGGVVSVAGKAPETPTNQSKSSKLKTPSSSVKADGKSTGKRRGTRGSGKKSSGKRSRNA